jgi:broad specificity phosphatase PhoE
VDDGLLLHVAVPAAAWWEDLPLACATTKVFRSEDEIEEWCRLNEVQRGAVVGLDQVERHAALWYADRIDPQWRRPGPGEAQRRLEAAGMTGPFWRLTAPAPA